MDQLSKNHALPKTHGFFSLSLGKLTLLLAVLLIAIPLFPLFTAWADVDSDIWQHLWQTQLATLILNTLSLATLVLIGVFLLGVWLAWLVTLYEFPGRKVLQWALMLPLAIPPYILAFVALGFTDFGGPLQTMIETFGGSAKQLPDIRNTFGVAIIFILCFYPYVYLLTRAALLKKGRSSYESARTLGYSKAAAFWKLIIPMTRPAWMAGLALVLMETLADFGAVAVFNYDTFTTAIYKSWFDLYSLNSAAQLASILLLFVMLALISERWGRGAERYTQSGSELSKFRKPLKGWLGLCSQIGAWFVCALAFILPIIQLIFWSAKNIAAGQGLYKQDAHLISNTVQLSLFATVTIMLIALCLVFVQHQLALRKKLSKFWSFISEFNLMGYALPGTVLAVGVVIGFNAIEDGLGLSEPLISGGIFALLFAYAVRFLRMAHNPLHNAMGQIKPTIIESSKLLGADKTERFWRVYLPLIRPGALTALLLVFVEVMKEMPATLLLRPMNWDTLAVRIYELTSEGEWERAALPAVLLVLVGILPVIYLIRKTER